MHTASLYAIMPTCMPAHHMIPYDQHQHNIKHNIKQNAQANRAGQARAESAAQGQTVPCNSTQCSACCGSAPTHEGDGIGHDAVHLLVGRLSGHVPHPPGVWRHPPHKLGPSMPAGSGAVQSAAPAGAPVNDVQELQAGALMRVSSVWVRLQGRSLFTPQGRHCALSS